MNEVIVGIDPSLTGLGVCILEQDGRYATHRFSSKPAVDIDERMRRYSGLVFCVQNITQDCDFLGIMLEGYAYNSKGKAIAQAEFGGILRWHLVSWCANVVEVPPTSLKIFECGKGQAKKPIAVAGLVAKYQVMFDSDDEFDAFGLAKIGAVLAGWEEPKAAYQRRAIDTVRPQWITHRTGMKSVR